MCTLLITSSVYSQKKENTINLEQSLPIGLMPKIDFSYDALTEGAPPDPNIAVSDRVVVITMNHRLAVYNKNNPGDLLFTADFAGLMNSETLPFDARVTYDYVNKRFIIVTAVAKNEINKTYYGLLVSRHNNPTNILDWCRYKMYPATAKDKVTFIDSPGISVSPEKHTLFLSANLYNIPNPQNPDAKVAMGGIIDKVNLDQVYTCQGGFTFKEVSNRITPGLNKLAESFRPVEWAMGSTSDKAYFINHHIDDTSTSKTYVWTMDNDYTIDNLPSVAVVNDSFKKSPGLRQIGGNTLPIITSPWYMQALYKEGMIWATHDVGSNNFPSSSVVLNKIDTSTNTMISYYREDSSDYAYQSFMLDKQGHVAVILNHTDFNSTPSKSVSIFFSGLTGQKSEIKDSDGITTDDESGDYSGSALDPNGTDLWFMHIYIDSNNKWRNRIIRLYFVTKPLYIPLIIR
jgi:hypothetical protein